MKLYLSHSSAYDFQKELYEPLKQGFGQSHTIFFPHDKTNEHVKSKDIIAHSDFVIAEVSLPATGQGIELGWADATGTPIVCFYRKGVKISRSLQFITDIFIEYTSGKEMTTKLSEWLKKAAT